MLSWVLSTRGTPCTKLRAGEPSTAPPVPPRCIFYLGESIEDLDDALGVDRDGHGSVQRVRRQLVLVHELRSGHGLGDGHQEVVRLREAIGGANKVGVLF